ncbi:MAG: T9SS type A sorting domain-containing protein [Bacteroidota bacterium]|nr:T9SS type A sorting domain-containing protein [Bacteroidota bacterium]
MKKTTLLIIAISINVALNAQFKIEKIALFSWNLATQAYNTDTLQKFVMKFESGEYAGYESYHTNNTKRDLFKSKVFNNGVNDVNVFGFGTNMYALEKIESDKVGNTWVNKRKTEYVRDSGGALVEFYMYNYVSNNWVLSLGHKYETYKTGNNVDSVIRFIKTAGTQFNWRKSNKNIYEYTGIQISKVINMTYWQDNIPDTNQIYYDIDWKDFDDRITPMHDNQRFGYLNGTLNSYKLRFNEKDYENDPDNWVEYEYNMTYNTNDQITELLSYNNFKYTYEYDSEGRFLSRLYSIFNGSVWQIQTGLKNIDTRDNDGNLILRHIQNYNTSTSNFVNNALVLINGAKHTSINQQDLQIAKIYPNPANSFIHIELNGLESVEILDISGRVQKVDVLSNGNACDIDISSLPEGIYFAKIIAEDKVLISKVVKN